MMIENELNKLFLGKPRVNIFNLLCSENLFQVLIDNNLYLILYLFICMSLSINFILAKKIIALEENIKKVVQKIALLN